MNLFSTGVPGFNFISVAAHLRDERFDGVYCQDGGVLRLVGEAADRL